jgi:hypothetical protein
MDYRRAESLAAQILREVDAEAIPHLERTLKTQDAPLEEQVAAKLARSKGAIDRWRGPLHVSVVFAMYRESTRILPPDRHPLGEDFINAKVAQLRWLFGDRDWWDLVMVDDGCPDGSGELANQIIAAQGFGDVARVLFLADAIADHHPVTSGLASPDDSRKGGAIQLGMYEAVADLRPAHIVVYTDADLSTHLGQIGLLAQVLADGADCAAGSRREPTSVSMKAAPRDQRGKIFIYLWKQMLPPLREIVDSQCGFKAFRGANVRELVAGTLEKGFAFDLELLLRTEIHRPSSVVPVPVAWIDSEAASTTTDLDPYLPMLQAVARMYRRYCDPEPWAESFVELIEAMDTESWHRLLEAIPAEIASREPSSFPTWSGVDAATIASCITNT